MADLDPIVGSEQGGIRPVLVVQNDIGNHYSPTLIVASLTSRKKRTRSKTHVWLSHTTTGLPQDSIVLLEQLRTIDRNRLVGTNRWRVPQFMMDSIDTALTLSVGLQRPRAEAVASAPAPVETAPDKAEPSRRKKRKKKKRNRRRRR